MLHETERRASNLPEAPSDRRLSHPLRPTPSSCTGQAARAAVVRIPDEDDVHLVHLRTVDKETTSSAFSSVDRSGSGLEDAAAGRRWLDADGIVLVVEVFFFVRGETSAGAASGRGWSAGGQWELVE